MRRRCLGFGGARRHLFWLDSEGGAAAPSGLWRRARALVPDVGFGPAANTWDLWFISAGFASHLVFAFIAGRGWKVRHTSCVDLPQDVPFK